MEIRPAARGRCMRRPESPAPIGPRMLSPIGKSRLWLAFPVAVLEVPAIAALLPMRGHPLHAPVLSHPAAIAPNMLAAIPSPISRGPDITSPRGGNDDDPRRRRWNIDIDDGYPTVPWARFGSGTGCERERSDGDQQHMMEFHKRTSA